MSSSRKSTSSWRPPNLPPSASIRSEFPVTCSPFPVTFRRSAVLLSIALLCPGAVKAQSGLVLRWGGDAEGGAPYVEADPNDPSHVTGFDVEVAQVLAAGLGRSATFVQSGFTTLDAAVSRGDFDVALSGIEDSATRRSRLSIT